MLDTRLPCYLLALDGPGWSHPYPTGPFSPFFYKDGGDGGDDGQGDDDGTDDKGDQDDDTDDDQDDDRDGDDQDDDGDDGLGEKGKKALRALRKENRTLKAENRTLKGTSTGKKPSAKDGDDGKDDDPEEIRRQAREEAQAEVWNDRVESAAIAVAAGRLANPQLAPRLLRDHLSDVPKDDKGRPDREAITELIDELLEDEPYLAAKSATDTGGRRFQGGADGGARKPAKKAAKSLEEAVAAKLAGKSGR